MLKLPVRWMKTARLILVPTVAAFLSFVFVVIRPLSNLGGEWAFLVFTTVLLFFFPSGSVVAQLEATVLGITGSAIGLGWSYATLAIAAYCGRRYGADSRPANAVVGVGLAILSLVCGFIRSYTPRLTAASRIALFFPIFLLTSNTGITHTRAALFVEQFLVTCFAAAFALLPTILLSYEPSVGPHLGQLVQESLQTASTLLPLSISSVLGTNLSDRLAALQASRDGSQAALAKSLKQCVAALRTTYTAYSVEVTHTKISPLTLNRLVKDLSSIQRNPLLGQTSHVPGERIQQALRRAYLQTSGSVTPSTPLTPRSSSRPRRAESPFTATPRGRSMTRDSNIRIQSTRFLHRKHESTVSFNRRSTHIGITSEILVKSIQSALHTTLAELSTVYGWVNPNTTKETPIREIKEELEFAVSAFQQDLSSLLHDLGGHHISLSDNVGDSSRTFGPEGEATRNWDHFRIAFYMTALLDLGKEIIKLLQTAMELSSQVGEQRQWYFPSIPGLSHLRKRTGSPPTMTEDGGAIDERPVVADHDSEDEFAFSQMDFATAALYRSRQTPGRPNHIQEWLMLRWRQIWDDKRIVKGRIALSRFLRGAKSSHHVYFAIKLAGGISILSIPAYLAPTSSARHYFDNYRGSWAVVSYMYVLETHTGAILKVGVFRVIGTFVGALSAYICTLIAHDNPYALVVLATALAVPISYLILFTRFPPIGIVAGITLPPLMFIRYLDPTTSESDFELAWTRFVNINIGIVAAIIVGCMLWPNHARVRYFRAVSTAFERATEYYLQMSRDLLRPSLVWQSDTKRYDQLESAVRAQITSCRSLIRIQRNEISLLPRPVKLYSEVVDASERLIESLAEIRLLRFSVPRKPAVFDVMPLRRELVSAILINLWALNQCFRSRSPLPQCLPSPRIALEGIMASLDDLARSDSSQKDGEVTETQSIMARDQLGILYGMAENEAIGELCTILDELVAAAGTLFGTRTFMGRIREDHEDDPYVV